MNEKLLKETMKKLGVDRKNEIEYPSSKSTDLYISAQESLNNANIAFKKIPKKNTKSKNKYLLRLYNNNRPFLDFNKGFYPNNTGIGKTISNDKLLTEQFLAYANVNTPDTRFFKPNEYEKAAAYVKKQSGKCVLKPKDLRQSLGAFRDVDIDNLGTIWKQNLKIQKQYKVKEPLIIIQKQIEGLELRITVIEGTADTATLRAPGYIVGDGTSTIKSLIENKNEQRKKNNFHNKNPFKFNDALNTGLSERNLNLNSVLNKDEYLILYPTVGIGTGRDNIEISDFIHPNIFKLAEKAVTAIPNIQTAGVDIIIENLDSEEGTILEVNQNPAFQVNYFNMYGRKQDPLAKLFSSIKLDNKILKDSLKIEDLTQDDFDHFINRYRFLFNKQKSLSESIEQLLHKK